MNSENAYHFPPDLMTLLIDTIPLLCRSKADLMLFFRGAGVPQRMTQDLAGRLADDRSSINKYAITRAVLTRLNDGGEQYLGIRRRLLQRVTQYDDLTSAWPDDQLKARGLLAQVRELVNAKDLLSRIINAQDETRRQRQAAERARVVEQQYRRRTELKALEGQCRELAKETDPYKRAKMLEVVLNQLFRVYGVLIRESFTVAGEHGSGIIEQIDGAIELDGHLYLVEMKWWAAPLGPRETSQHFVRIFSRADARGIFISASGYTDAVVETCRTLAMGHVAILTAVSEFAQLVEQEGDSGAVSPGKSAGGTAR